MDISVELNGGKKVTGRFHGFDVVTDQPKDEGGGDSAPSPFELFLASLATCAGFFVQSFCQTRGIPTDGISLLQRSERDEMTHLVSKIHIEVRLPASFPEKYRASVVAAANQCTVKRHLQNPPEMDVIAIIA